jgi:hypothetical protein
MTPSFEKNADLAESQIEPKHVDGGNLPAINHDLNRPLNEEEKPFVVPSEPERSEQSP